MADSLPFYSEILRGPQVLGKREKAQAAQQYLSYDAMLLMGKLINHAKVIGITYLNVSRFYIHQCEFIIGEFDELILNLENKKRDNDSTAASDMHDKVTQ